MHGDSFIWLRCRFAIYCVFTYRFYFWLLSSCLLFFLWLGYPYWSITFFSLNDWLNVSLYFTLYFLDFWFAMRSSMQQTFCCYYLFSSFSFGVLFYLPLFFRIRTTCPVYYNSPQTSRVCWHIGLFRRTSFSVFHPILEIFTLSFRTFSPLIITYYHTSVFVVSSVQSFVFSLCFFWHY
ncbi:hypothetical protein BC829DRAFT_194633 [Chytridium lagenaria]|nr:hypothetical protein BC829DRAFT_194633 [Chytridium lagenaria]